MFSRNLCGIDCDAASRSPLTCCGRGGRELDRWPAARSRPWRRCARCHCGAPRAVSPSRRSRNRRSGPSSVRARAPTIGFASLVARARGGAGDPRGPSGSGGTRSSPGIASISARPCSTSPASATATPWLRRVDRRPVETAAAPRRRRRASRRRTPARGRRRSPPAAGTARAVAAPRLVASIRSPSSIACAVPEAAILVGEEDELSVRRHAGVPARVLEEHQREQPVRLRLVGHEDAEKLCEPDRLGTEVAADERLRRSSLRSPR